MVLEAQERAVYVRPFVTSTLRSSKVECAILTWAYVVAVDTFHVLEMFYIFVSTRNSQKLRLVTNRYYNFHLLIFLETK